MFTMYANLDPIIESFLLNIGMSAKSVDFTMLGLGGLAIILISVIYLALAVNYGRLLLNAYLHMITEESVRLRRNWSLIFLVTLFLGIMTIAIIF